MQLVNLRAPDGFTRIQDVLTPAELEGTAARYKQIVGFDKDTLNAQPPIVSECQHSQYIAPHIAITASLHSHGFSIEGLPLAS